MAELSDRLRDLRITFPVTQPQLAIGIGDEVQSPNGRQLSTSTISSWETGRLVPSIDQLAVLARFYCTPRSLQGEPHLLPAGELTPDEQGRWEALQQELIGFRTDAGSRQDTAEAGGRPPWVTSAGPPAPDDDRAATA